ncbi:Sperm acrosome-associated protein 7 [Manis javanica]|nr:Sperm acrosome-associated protein 7 [Manis javanica]
MAAGLAVTLPALLLSCWREADLQPLSSTPEKRASASFTEGPATEVLSNSRNPDDDIATVFDKILVHEILDPDESAEAETQATAGASATKLLKEKKARVRMNYQTDTSKKHHGRDSILRIKTDFPLMKRTKKQWIRLKAQQLWKKSSTALQELQETLPSKEERSVNVCSKAPKTMRRNRA